MKQQKSLRVRELTLTSVFIALSVVFYMIDKYLTLGLNAVWATGGATTLAYFLPVIILGLYMRKELFFMGVFVLSIAMFILGTSAVSIVDFGLEYVIPLTSLSVFLLCGKLSGKQRYIGLYAGLFLTLGITCAAYVVAGVIFYNVPFEASLSYNGTLMILPTSVLCVLIIPTHEVGRQLLK